MRWFGKSEAVSPEIADGLIVASYSSQEECWTFEYEGVEYLAYGHRLNLLDHAELEIIHNDILALMPEMKERLHTGWQEEGEAVSDDGAGYFVNISEFRSRGEYGVCWAGGAGWGDMSIEFTIQNHRIIDEVWGD